MKQSSSATAPVRSWFASIVSALIGASSALLRRLTSAFCGRRSSPEALAVQRQSAAELARTRPPEFVGGSYDGGKFLPPEEVGGNEILLPANLEASAMEFYRFDGRAWRFVCYCQEAETEGSDGER